MFVRLYLLGDIVDDLELRNLTCHELLRGMVSQAVAPSASLVSDIWKSTPAGSLLRKMLVELAVARGKCHSCFTLDIAKLPAEYVQEVAVAALAKIPTSNPAGEEVLKAVEQYLESKEQDNRAN